MPYFLNSVSHWGVEFEFNIEWEFWKDVYGKGGPGAKQTEIDDWGEKGKYLAQKFPGMGQHLNAVYEKHIDNTGNFIPYDKITYNLKGELCL